jgi:hypothetical protein
MADYTSNEDIEVRIALSPRAAVYARERPWRRSQKLTEQPDGRTELTLRLNHLGDARNRVLRWGAQAECFGHSSCARKSAPNCKKHWDNIPLPSHAATSRDFRTMGALALTSADAVVPPLSPRQVSHRTGCQRYWRYLTGYDPIGDSSEPTSI